MSDNGHNVADRYYEFMRSPVDHDSVADIYAPDALVIRFDATSTGPEEISTFLSEVRSRHQPYELHRIEQLTQVGDVVMWDAVIDTSNGMLETTEVLVLDSAGQIKRHIPGIRGYWGL